MAAGTALWLYTLAICFPWQQTIEASFRTAHVWDSPHELIKKQLRETKTPFRASRSTHCNCASNNLVSERFSHYQCAHTESAFACGKIHWHDAPIELNDATTRNSAAGPRDRMFCNWEGLNSLLGVFHVYTCWYLEQKSARAQFIFCQNLCLGSC